MAQDCKVWFITGTSRGLGRVWAEAALERGDRVVATARDISTLDDLAARFGDTVLTLPLDVTDREAAFGAVQQGHDHFGRLDLVVNNAGFGLNSFAWEMPPERAVEMIRLNVEAFTVIAMESAKRMVPRGRGAIINLSSTAAFQATPYMAIYGATKGYDLLFSEALHEELRETGVRVFTMCPGYTQTEFQGVANMPAPPPKRFVTDAESCVRRGLDAFVLGEKLYIDGSANAALQFMQRFVPRSWVVSMSARALKRKPKA